MKNGKAPAPVFVDVFKLSEWLLEKFDADQRFLPRTICESITRLLEAVTLALKGRMREERVELADELLISLRIQLRLANTIGYLSEDQLLFALEQADAIGRQIGGWMRSLDSP